MEERVFQPPTRSRDPPGTRALVQPHTRGFLAQVRIRVLPSSTLTQSAPARSATGVTKTTLAMAIISE